MDIATQEWKVPNAKSKFTHIITHSCLSVNFMAGPKYVSDLFVPVMSVRAGKINKVHDVTKTRIHQPQYIIYQRIKLKVMNISVKLL
jgi:hypothetical protein